MSHPVCPDAVSVARTARRPAVQPVSVEDDNAARRRFGGHALQGGRIGLILVAHGHRVVPVTQHGRQDASLSGSDEAQGILGADRQHGVRRVRRAIVGRRADGQDPPPTAPERRCACRRGQRMRRRRRCRPRAAGQPTARDRRRSHSRRAFLLAMQLRAGAVDACPAGWPSRCAGRMISPASISADSTAPSNACAASGSRLARAPRPREPAVAAGAIRPACRASRSTTFRNGAAAGACRSPGQAAASASPPAPRPHRRVFIVSSS